MKIDIYIDYFNIIYHFMTQFVWFWWYRYKLLSLESNQGCFRLWMYAGLFILRSRQLRLTMLCLTKHVQYAGSTFRSTARLRHHCGVASPVSRTDILMHMRLLMKNSICLSLTAFSTNDFIIRLIHLVLYHLDLSDNLDLLCKLIQTDCYKSINENSN